MFELERSRDGNGQVIKKPRGQWYAERAQRSASLVVIYRGMTFRCCTLLIRMLTRHLTPSTSCVTF
ncbi:hypothetical protein PISMIDRAFT_675326 [Pisolithus microcarpus 441]|uniref:Uncharacterized protein n=1 Tax=Pisolithus microcarpus 441 TaxID=765257 RepID=A0A0C9ZCQ0_9AGAM|nr:hypothetical protein PISMIDRAFT_675326 [Pisolithus microcarpus 441]